MNSWLAWGLHIRWRLAAMQPSTSMLLSSHTAACTAGAAPSAASDGLACFGAEGGQAEPALQQNRGAPAFSGSADCAGRRLRHVIRTIRRGKGIAAIIGSCKQGCLFLLEHSHKS